MRCSVCGAVVKTMINGTYYCPICHSYGSDYKIQNCDMPLLESFGARYGWVCPRCGKVYSPNVNSCGCNSTSGTIKSNTTESIPVDIPIGTISFNRADVKDIDSITAKYNSTITLRNNKDKHE